MISQRHPFLDRPHRTLIGLSVPVMAALVVEPLAGLVDTAFVERLGAARVQRWLRLRPGTTRSPLL